MNIPVNVVTWGVAVLPIIILLVLMTVFHLGAMKAAPVGAAVTIISGYLIYKADMKVILSEGGKGAWNAFIILLIVWTAVLLYQVGNEVHAFRAIRNGMRSFLPNELLLVLALGWIFESFLQGITGFGVPVAVGAPLLIGIGVKPMWAVIIPLLGQSWGNTYGTLGAAWDALAMTSGLEAGSVEYIQTAGCAGILLWLWNFILGMQICWFYGKGSGIKKGLPAAAVISLIQGGGELLLSQVNTTIACFVPACISLLALIVLGKTRWYCEEWKLDESRIMERGAQEESRDDQKNMSLLYALFPYILLSAITLLVLVVKPLNEILGSVSIGFSFPETVTGYGYTNAAEPKYSPLSLFTHASMFLLVSSVIAMMIYKKAGYIKDGGISRIFKRSFSMAFPSSIAVLCLVVMSRIMSGTGQTIVLANGISSVLGNAYLLLTPFIGMLGSFMTGSNMSSNILFGNFQIMTAKLLSSKIPWMLGAQTAGGSIGSAISPSNIVLGTTTANILGQEGNVLKRTSSIVVPVALVMGIFNLFVRKINLNGQAAEWRNQMHMEKIAERMEKDLKHLEQYTATPGKGCTRLPFTKEARMAVEFLKERMLEAGFTVHEDEAGNVIGVLAGEEPELPCIMMGSHYDSVINGGNYDGIAGVVTAIEVARQLKERGIRRKRNFVAVGFCDEEGTRFGTGFFGSGALFGKYDVDYCKKFCDSDGISIYDAMKEYGLNAEELGKAAWKKESIGYFIESHIEQGPVLEREEIELGLVDGIVGLQRYMVTVHGRADHAGTTPMEMRSDAMEVASGVIAKIPQWAREMQDGTVATVGYINSCPGGINIVAEKVSFSVDVRSMNNEHIECIVEKMKQELQKIADSHDATFDIEEKLRIEPLHLSEKLLALMENSCKEHKFTYRRMCSGAGHDTLEIGQNGIPSVMVFVPSKDGRSHCPVEWSSYEDLAKAATVAADLAEELVNE